jgi:hypothetical protein
LPNHHRNEVVHSFRRRIPQLDEVEQGSEMIDWLKVLMDENNDREASERAQVVLELLLDE